MFQKANKPSDTTAASINLIGNGTSITGDITSNGDVRIDGVLKGNLTITGKLVVGPSGNIEGNISCQNADISGEIHGKINVKELLTLKSTAKLLGDFVTERIVIENGALFTGYSSMGNIVKNITNVGEKRQAAAQTA
jgi:cytoskeletal protein CcmA (bactofilin family)